jgi:hypothetical protein
LAYAGAFPHFATVTEDWTGYPLALRSETHTDGAAGWLPGGEYGWGLTPDEWAIFLRDFFGGRITELYGLRRDALGRALVLWLQEWRPLVYEEVDALREEEAARHLPQLTDAEVEENQRRIRLAIEKLRQQLDVS